jgi:hypothetical protein
LARLALTGHDPFAALDPRRRLVVTSAV